MTTTETVLTAATGILLSIAALAALLHRGAQIRHRIPGTSIPSEDSPLADLNRRGAPPRHGFIRLLLLSRALRRIH